MQSPRITTLALLFASTLLQPAHCQTPILDRLNDPLPDGAIARLGTGRFCHPDFVEATAWSPKGDRFVSSGVVGSTILWEWPSGKKIQEFPVKARSLAFSADGRWLATIGSWFELWDVSTGMANREMPAKLRNGTAFAFSADGTRLATADGKGWLGEWNLRDNTFRERAAPGEPRFLALGYNSKNELLAAGVQKGQVVLWHVGKEWRAFALMPAFADLYCMAFSPNSGKLAVPRPDLAIAVFQPDTGQSWAELKGGHVNLRFQNPSRIGSLQFNFDGTRLASASWDSTVCVWNVSQKKKLYNLAGLNGTGRVSFSPDGKLLATAGPNHPHRAVFWDAATGKQADPYVQHYSDLRSLSVSADGKVVATVSGTRDDPWVHLWEATTGKPIRSLFAHPGGCYDVKFSPDGAKLASGGRDRIVRIWEAASGKLLHELKGDHAWVTHLAFSPNGKWLASGDNFIHNGNYFGKTCVWDVEKGELIKLLEGQSGAIDSLAFTPDGKRLLTGAHGLRVWKTGTWERERELATDVGRVWAMAISPDGRFVFTGYTGVPRLWEWDTGQVVATLPKEWSGYACEFSADGRTLAIVTANGRLLLWHWPSQKVIWGRTEARHPLAFSPQGDWLATGENSIAAALVWKLPASVQHARLDKTEYDSNRFLEAWRRLAGPADQAYPALWQCASMGDAILDDLKKQWQREAEIGPAVRIWINKLNDDDFKVRAEAYRQLKQAGNLAGPFLRQALAKPASLEQKRRLEELLKSAEGVDIVQRQRRTCMLLEQIGTEAAVQMLIELKSGEADPDLQDDADRSLARLKQRKSGVKRFGARGN